MLSEATFFAGGICFKQLLTKAVIRDLIRHAEVIRVIRSGVYFTFGHYADLIEEICNASERPKDIKIILPSVFNEDVVVRASEAGRDPAEVLAMLGSWQETLATLGQRLSPDHSLELRTTMSPHRYHTIFTESGGILGVPWHTRASLTTTSFTLGDDATSVVLHLHEDFDAFWRTCSPYENGDNERMRKAGTATRRVDDPVLLEFGRRLPRVMEVLRYLISAFPSLDGNGATKADLDERFGLDESDSNKLLAKMEEAGLLRRLGDRTEHNRHHGRIATRYGCAVAEKYRNVCFDKSRWS